MRRVTQMKMIGSVLNKISPIVISITLGATLLIALTGCELPEPEMYEFKGKQYTEEQLEEVVESMIEIDNPDIDFDVNIQEDVD